MPNNNTAHSTSPNQDSEFNPTEQEINDLLEKFHPQDDDVIELSDTDLVEIQELQHKTREKIIPPHITFGVPDTKFQKPVSKTLELPKNMYAFAGNENGSTEVQLATGEAYATTDIGVNHEINDDGILIDKNTDTMIITDGVGSSRTGYAASALATYGTAQFLKKGTHFNELPTLLHRAVQTYQKHNGPKFEDCSTTLVAMRLSKKDQTVEFVHVGDSKALLIRNGKLVYNSQDDNLLSFMMESRNIGEEKAKDLISKLDVNPSSIIQSLGHDANAINLKTGETRVVLQSSNFGPLCF